ncbi:putative ribonuclease H protein [Senna tora]|uniref:Putative ribonuclease H protein n=1 Tax=Senna tora TaxID=362788 RepID=A0A834X8X4_9FABA|nr:putative ribonuclease H protein [Senna tora]
MRMAPPLVWKFPNSTHLERPGKESLSSDNSSDRNRATHIRNHSSSNIHRGIRHKAQVLPTLISSSGHRIRNMVTFPIGMLNAHLPILSQKTMNLPHQGRTGMRIRKKALHHATNHHRIHFNNNPPKSMEPSSTKPRMDTPKLSLNRGAASQVLQKANHIVTILISDNSTTGRMTMIPSLRRTGPININFNPTCFRRQPSNMLNHTVRLLFGITEPVARLNKPHPNTFNFGTVPKSMKGILTTSTTSSTCRRVSHTTFDPLRIGQKFIVTTQPHKGFSPLRHPKKPHLSPEVVFNFLIHTCNVLISSFDTKTTILAKLPS